MQFIFEKQKTLVFAVIVFANIFFAYHAGASSDLSSKINPAAKTRADFIPLPHDLAAKEYFSSSEVLLNITLDVNDHSSFSIGKDAICSFALKEIKTEVEQKHIKVYGCSSSNVSKNINNLFISIKIKERRTEALKYFTVSLISERLPNNQNSKRYSLKEGIFYQEVLVPDAITNEAILGVVKDQIKRIGSQLISVEQ